MSIPSKTSYIPKHNIMHTILDLILHHDIDMYIIYQNIIFYLVNVVFEMSAACAEGATLWFSSIPNFNKRLITVLKSIVFKHKIKMVLYYIIVCWLAIDYILFSTRFLHRLNRFPITGATTPNHCLRLLKCQRRGWSYNVIRRCPAHHETCEIWLYADSGRLSRKFGVTSVEGEILLNIVQRTKREKKNEKETNN